MIEPGVTPGSKSSGAWDSIHVFEATDRARMSHYKLTSTVILHLSSETDALGSMDLSGNMTRQVESDMPVESDASHVANVGRLVEDMELKMRNLLRKLPYNCMVVLNFPASSNEWSCFVEEVYFGKAKDVVGDLRSKFTIYEASWEIKIN
jgi:capping protein beta